MQELKRKISTLKTERTIIFLMTENEICNKYNVDERSEALQLIDEEIAYFESELSDSIEAEERRECEFWGSVRYLNNYPKALCTNV